MSLIALMTEMVGEGGKASMIRRSVTVFPICFPLLFPSEPIRGIRAIRGSIA